MPIIPLAPNPARSFRRRLPRVSPTTPAWICRLTSWLASGLLLVAGTVPAFAQLAVNFPGPAPLTSPEDTPLEVRFTVGLAGFAAGSIFAEASLIPAPLATVGAVLLEGTNGLVRLHPAPDQFGSGSLWVVVRGKAESSGLPLVSSNRVTVSWTPVNDAPRFAPVPAISVRAGEPPLAVMLSVSDPENTGFTLQVSAAQPELFSELDVPPPNGLRYLRLSATPHGIGGNTVVTITARDSRGAAGHVSIPVQVLPAARRSISTRMEGSTNTAGLAVDLNADGRLDLVCQPSFGRALYRLNEGNLKFTNFVSATPAAGMTSRWVDLNGDGLPDVAGDSGGLLQVRPGPESASPSFVFGPTNLANRVVNGRTYEWLDVDGDGALEPAFSSRHQNGSVVAATNNLPRSSGRAIAGDFDGDGRPDVLLSDVTLPLRGYYGLWRNEGGFRFSPSLQGLWLNTPTAHGTVDFDGDGRIDVWVVETNANGGQLQLWRNGLAGFDLSAQFDAGVAGTHIPQWGDLNDDGHVDFIFPRLSTELYFTNQAAAAASPVGRQAFLVVYQNDGAGHFGPAGRVGTYVLGQPPVLVDLDGDGSLEIWLPGPDERILLPARPANALPTAPQNLRAIQTTEGILFLWDRAFDPNQAAPLSYNLRVGTQPGSNDVIASLATAAGRRLVPAPGNNDFNSHRLLTLTQREFANPAPSRLFWSVQAVDNSHAGGAWAPEQAVEVALPRNEPPIALDVPNSLVLNESLASLRFTVRDAATPPGGFTYRLLADDPTLVITQKNPQRLVQFGPLSTASVVVKLKPGGLASAETELSLIVSDHGGMSTTNRVKLTLGPIQRGLLRTRESPEGIQLWMYGYLGSSVGVEASDDLRDWEQVTQASFYSDNGQVLLIAPRPTVPGEARFYRVVFP